MTTNLQNWVSFFAFHSLGLVGDKLICGCLTSGDMQPDGGLSGSDWIAMMVMAHDGVNTAVEFRGTRNRTWTLPALSVRGCGQKSPDTPSFSYTECPFFTRVQPHQHWTLKMSQIFT